ncbi:MAG TPA: aspartate carbamoyltransferase catalytic subunit [bacterium]|nr:aspartate carbamoyltransferase catalytic subunit [bacterium]
MKHLLGIENLNRDQILHILETAVSFEEINQRQIKKVPTLKGISVINFFAEPSTRTRMSFEVAEKRLSADTYNIAVSGSAITKGETLADTALNLQAMAPDCLVIRHAVSGTPHMLAQIMDCSVVNAGDGFHEHPTQALLDAYTIQKKKKRLDGLKIALLGDIAHSRVARSNIHLLTKTGSQVVLAGPATMMPRDVEKLGVTVTGDPKEAIKDADVVMMLRIQEERESGLMYPDRREYAKFFCLDDKLLAHARPDAIVMHPGPANRGVEIEDHIMDGDRSVILEQVANGVAVRMAVLYLLLGGSNS